MLLSLGGPMQTRLTATVAAAWRERLRDGAAPAGGAARTGRRLRTRAAPAGCGRDGRGPAGAARGAVRPGGGCPAGAGPGSQYSRVVLTMIPEGARQALARDGDGLAAELPFGWITEVLARGLGTCWDRFCLAAARMGTGGCCPPSAPTWARPPRSRSGARATRPRHPS